MEIRVDQTSALSVETPLLVVNLFEDVKVPSGATGAVDTALGGLLSRLIAEGELTGKSEEMCIVHVPDGAKIPARRVGIVGLGKQAEFGPEAVRVASAVAARKANDLKLDSFATVVHGAGQGGLDPADAARALAEGTLLGVYRYREFKSPNKDQPERDIQRVVIVEQAKSRIKHLERGVELGQMMAEATNLARTLSVGPPNVVTPAYLADQARQVAERFGLGYQVFWKDDLERMGMNAILAVNSGSARPPCLTLLRYNGGGKSLAVVGKGITFDSGGISIKPSEGMKYMRHDMSGAAAVIGFVQLAAATKLKINLLGAFPATENLPGAAAYKPGDIVRAFNGKTIEIDNTDAEGRVVLSDALAYCTEQGVDAIVDLATLTGACHVALGDYATGAMGNDDTLIKQMIEAGERAGERVWQLPLWKVYHKQIESPVADIVNSGGRAAGAITAAAFLQNFVGDTPWVHLDIAGTAYTNGQQRWVPPYQPKVGGTGVGVRLLYEFCRSWGAE